MSALAAGCTVVCKPSPETPITVAAFAKLSTQVGSPDGVVSVDTTSIELTPKVGEKLCVDPRIKELSFTGSTRVSARDGGPRCARVAERSGREDPQSR